MKKWINYFRHLAVFLVFFIVATLFLQIYGDFSNNAEVGGKITIATNENTYEYLQRASEKFMAKNPKANINIVTVNEFNFASLRDENISVLNINSSDLEEVMNSDEYASEISKDNSITDTYSNNFANSRLEEVKFQGQVVAIPLTTRPLVMYLREDMLNQYGYKYDDMNTWDDFIKIGKDIYQKSNGKVKILNVTGQDYKDLVAVLTMQIMELQKNLDKATPEVISNLVKEKIDLLRSNNILNESDGGEFLARVASINGMRELAALEEKCSWVPYNMPSMIVGGNKFYIGEGENLLIINKKEENSELIRRFIGYLTSNSNFAIKDVISGKFYLSFLNIYKDVTIEENINNFNEKSPLVIMSNIAEKAPKIKDYDLYRKSIKLLIR